MIMVAVGIVASRLGWITEPVNNFLTKFAINVAIPATLFVNAIDSLSVEQLSEDWPLLFIPLITIMLNILISYLITRVYAAARPRRGVFILCFSMSNSIFIGLPVCLAIFGKAASSYVTLYYIVNTFIFWSLGASLLARDGGKKAGGGLSMLKNLLSPPIFAFLLGLIAVLTGLSHKLPAFIEDAVRSLAGLNTPLCMLFLSVVIARLGIKGSLKLPKGGWLVLLGRFIISPAIMVAACLIFGVPPLPAGVFTAESAMPVMNQTVIMAHSCGADYEFCSQLMAATVLLMILFIPLLTLVIGAAFPIVIG